MVPLPCTPAYGLPILACWRHPKDAHPLHAMPEYSGDVVMILHLPGRAVGPRARLAGKLLRAHQPDLLQMRPLQPTRARGCPPQAPPHPLAVITVQDLGLRTLGSRQGQEHALGLAQQLRLILLEGQHIVIARRRHQAGLAQGAVAGVQDDHIKEVQATVGLEELSPEGGKGPQLILLRPQRIPIEKQPRPPAWVCCCVVHLEDWWPS
jgi:hypothetical protein